MRSRSTAVVIVWINEDPEVTGIKCKVSRETTRQLHRLKLIDRLNAQPSTFENRGYVVGFQVYRLLSLFNVGIGL